MREFSLSEFALHLLEVEAAELLALHHGLKKCAAAIEATAKAEIGTYQRGVGYFPPWQELAPATKADRVHKGFTENDPLLRTGGLRDSISSEVHALEAAIGSTSDIMVYQELGTSTIPPRAVLGPAAVRNHKRIEMILGEAAVAGLLYGSGEEVVKLE